MSYIMRVLVVRLGKVISEGMIRMGATLIAVEVFTLLLSKCKGFHDDVIRFVIPVLTVEKFDMIVNYVKIAMRRILT